MSEYGSSQPNLGFRRQRFNRGREHIVGHGERVKLEVRQFTTDGRPATSGRKSFTDRYGGILPNT